MLKEEFDQFGFESGDFVEIIFKDSSSKKVQLMQGKAYSGHQSKSSYTDKFEGLKEVSPSIVVYNPLKPEGEGISLENVAEVRLIKRPSDNQIFS